MPEVRAAQPRGAAWDTGREALSGSANPGATYLLRQPGGLEGFGMAQEALGFQHPSAPDGEDPPCRGVDRHATFAAPRLDVTEGQDAISQVAKLGYVGLISSKASSVSANHLRKPS
jgi:hypothetical protein